jgi:hypothetical protein
VKLEYYHFFEYLSFIFSLVYYKGLKSYSLQLMAPFLLYICCSETVASYYVEFGMPTARGFVNVYYVVSAAVFYVLFYNMLKPKAVYEKTYKIIAVLSMIFFLLDLFTGNIFEVNTATVYISFIQHIFLCLLLLFKLAFDENSRISILKHPYFWIAVGVLIFSLVTMVAWGLLQYMFRNQVKIFGKNAYLVIIQTSCVVLYSCYCYAFYLTSKTKGNDRSLQQA